MVYKLNKKVIKTNGGELYLPSKLMKEIRSSRKTAKMFNNKRIWSDAIKGLVGNNIVHFGMRPRSPDCSSFLCPQEDTIQREGHMRWGEGFVLVYDITDRGSFEEVLPLKNILDEVKKPKNVTLILVGNKADLDHSRQVSTEEGEKLATELACAFYECSACTGEGNITEVFYELCREVRRRRMVQGKTRRRSSTTHVKQAINKMLTKISS